MLTILLVVLVFQYALVQSNFNFKTSIFGTPDPLDEAVPITIHYVWDYGDGVNGVQHWPSTCSTGMKQSPVDIVSENTTVQEGVCPFVFNKYDEIPLELKLKSKWHSLYFWQIVKEGKKRVPYLTGGGLPGDEFEFWSGHFHWASEGDGSEHHADNDKAALELHLVHWNKAKGKTPKEAIASNEWNALAVLGIKYDVGKHNKNLEPLFDAMDQVHEEGKSTKLKKKLSLKSFLPRSTGRFFRYNGSLTTPPCSEVVIWTVFKDREFISQDQMDKLRAARSGEDRRRQLENNYRPVQSLNGRAILDIDTRNYGNICKTRYTSSSNSNISQYKTCLLIVTMCIMFVNFYNWK